MELRDALRMLRSETGLTQSEFAVLINVGYSAESRWENQNTRPNRSSSAAILALARQRRVSAVCLDALTEILLAPRVNDKADKALMEQVTARMKMEQRELLTSEQLKEMIDNLDLAVIGHRIYSISPDKTAVFYHNRRYAQIFGYDDAEEFDRRSDENIYFGIPQESLSRYQQLVKRLLEGRIALSDFAITLRGFQKNGNEIWLEVKGISLARFSFGYEFFISCRDVTARVEAERKYQEEVAVRDASIQAAYASLYCDLESNRILRHRNLPLVTGRECADDTIDEFLSKLAAATPEGPGSLDFRRKNLLSAYENHQLSGSLRLFNTVARRWMRVEYALIRNPYTARPEAAIYLYDINPQAYAEKMTRIVAGRFFEYVGVIDTANKTFESYYYDSRVFHHSVDGARDYATICGEKLKKHADAEDYAAQREAVSLETILRRLESETFYTALLRLRDYEGAARLKRVTYTYLDETKTKIVMAQSDRDNIIRTIEGGDGEAHPYH